MYNFNSAFEYHYTDYSKEILSLVMYLMSSEKYSNGSSFAVTSDTDKEFRNLHLTMASYGVLREYNKIPELPSDRQPRYKFPED